MPANSVRPWLRLLVAYRDRGICKICGRKVEGETGSKRLKVGYRDGALPRGGKIIYGDKQPTIDHIAGKGAGITRTSINRFYISNLTLAHKSCNSKKKEDGDIPTDKQLEAAYRELTNYDIEKIKKILLDIGYSEADVRSDRAVGRAIFRDFAVYMANKGRPPPPPKDEDFPF